jgi:TolA-binding protein
VPDALLKTGYIAYDENKNKQARDIFQQVISKYPQSQAANLAKQRLARMDAEKR